MQQQNTNKNEIQTSNCVHQVKMMAFTYVAQNVIKRFYQIRNQLDSCSHLTIPIHIYKKLCVGKCYHNLKERREELSITYRNSSQIFHLWHAGCTASGACTSRVYLFQYTQSGAQGQGRVRKQDFILLLVDQLKFNLFPPSTHSRSNCTDGYLKIYLKGQETADAYDKFDYELCGNETQRVISDGPRLAMVFSSGELQGRGFKGKYTFETEYKIPGTAAPDGTCSFTYVSSSKKRGELNSPRYPSNYPSDTNCSYLFLAEPNEQVTIVFDHFKIKADNNVNATAGSYG